MWVWAKELQFCNHCTNDEELSPTSMSPKFVKMCAKKVPQVLSQGNRNFHYSFQSDRDEGYYSRRSQYTNSIPKGRKCRFINGRHVFIKYEQQDVTLTGLGKTVSKVEDERAYAHFYVDGQRISFTGSGVQFKHSSESNVTGRKLEENTGAIKVFRGGQINTICSVYLSMSSGGANTMARRFLITEISPAILGFMTA
ncbi:unnamed protein product [Lepeophtheirus salmonis]|uniref:(salmon louse) hypothetical protein n=1 Tax=Lepeophtheirus salmonis TaxID=72036 RepID=A0A7R8CAK9_LEPSM|nr:unnamed protein product [Lepeophtheirus salmonis]CAF2752132.1 unnamed protein product [Lepeophtheirus salmonis]